MKITWRLVLISALMLCVIAILSFAHSPLPDFSQRNLVPSMVHPFGTDHMGRDLLNRSLAGLWLSLWIGILAAGLSTIIALFLALFSGIGAWADALVRFVTDAMLALPHLMILILLAFAFGGGTAAVIGAVALSHWPRLTLILRAEVVKLQSAPFTATSRGFGKSRSFILWHHMLPHLVAQAIVGFTLTFPHAILHEAGLSFLGFGLEPSRPAIGVMLSDALAHLSAGRWWLAFFPGAMLLALALLVESLGQALQQKGRGC